MSTTPQSGAFVTTHWTQVLQARGDSPEAKAALSDLCEAYYKPVFVFIRRNTQDEESARELTQEFFARLLGRKGVDGVNPELGRFRSFLLGAVRHFLLDAKDHAHRLKRGGGTPDIRLDQGSGSDTSPGLQVEDAQALSPEREFDRRWALTVLDRALSALADEHQRNGESDQFEMLKPWLTGDAGDLSQADAAQRLGMNEGAVKVAIHRLRRRFRDSVKNEIARTLNDPSHVADELACLVAALSGR